jgi:hypothetical protein
MQIYQKENYTLETSQLMQINSITFIKVASWQAVEYAA